MTFRSRLARTVLMCASLTPAQLAIANDIELPRTGRAKHLGVAACASNVCHGKIAPQAGSDVGLNEYKIWLEQDKHARAYEVLKSARSTTIAEKLQLGDATRAKVCLDCHSDNVPLEKRATFRTAVGEGPKFRIEDGIGCESCHGGAESWIGNHNSRAVSHRENLAAGLFPTERPLERARVCLSCHLGTRDQFANHLIMAAGHPRLVFELASFTANEPPHFTVDEDYRRRKGAADATALWLAGQLQSARQSLSLLESDLFRPADSMFPELALYDCHSCHHSFDQARWTAVRATAGTKPGTLRLQAQALIILQAALQVLDPPSADGLRTLTADLVKAGRRDAEETRRAAQAVLGALASLDNVASRRFPPEEIAAIRKSLLTCAAEERAADYATAEQIAMGVETLSFALRDQVAKRPLIDPLFKALKSGATFDPSRFSAAARAALGKL